MGKSHVFKFISGKYQGGEFPIPMDSELIIGRSSDLEMVLAEEMVSRKHAKIITKNAKIVLQDLGSTNGTFVNGERITIYPLKTGDRVLIGTSIFKLLEVEGSSDALSPENKRDIKSRLQAITAAKKTITRTYAERISEIPVIDILQLYQTTKRTGTLAIRSYRNGKIFMREGAIVSACIDDDFSVNPYKALFRILAWDKGNYHLEPLTIKEFPQEIDQQPEAVLAEGKRQLDEIAKLPRKFPYTANIKLRQPLAPRLRDLTPDHLDTLQAILNQGKIEGVLNEILAADYEVFHDFVYLIEAGYIEIIDAA